MELVQVIEARKKDPDYPYNPNDFYWVCLKSGQDSWAIATELVIGTEKSVQEAICTYLIGHGLSSMYCDFVRSVAWRTDYTRAKSATESQDICEIL